MFSQLIIYIYIVVDLTAEIEEPKVKAKAKARAKAKVAAQGDEPSEPKPKAKAKSRAKAKPTDAPEAEVVEEAPVAEEEPPPPEVEQPAPTVEEPIPPNEEPTIEPVEAETTTRKPKGHRPKIENKTPLTKKVNCKKCDKTVSLHSAKYTHPKTCKSDEPQPLPLSSFSVLEPSQPLTLREKFHEKRQATAQRLIAQCFK